MCTFYDNLGLLLVCNDNKITNTPILCFEFVLFDVLRRDNVETSRDALFPLNFVPSACSPARVPRRPGGGRAEDSFEMKIKHQNFFSRSRSQFLFRRSMERAQHQQHFTSNSKNFSNNKSVSINQSYDEVSTFKKGNAPMPRHRETLSCGK